MCGKMEGNQSIAVEAKTALPSQGAPQDGTDTTGGLTENGVQSASDAERAIAVLPFEQEANGINLSRPVTYRLYISHFLSTWNSRVFEFGAVLFLAALYPGSLASLSIYALVRSGSAIILSPTVGRIIDNKDRLHVVRFSIVVQRGTIIASCVVFLLLALKIIAGSSGRKAGLAGLSLLACVEKLCSIVNLVSVERDWVVVITGDDESARRLLNSRMRRIDLLCKLLGPLVISLVNAGSLKVAIIISLGMNILSLPAEVLTITTVFRLVPSLKRPLAATDGEGNADPPGRIWLRISLYLKSLAANMVFYFRHRALYPSFALALLYFTVLSFSGQMITFLLFSGYTSAIVGAIRTISTVFELSATWIGPRVMKRIGAVRAGIWFLNWQMICLAAGVSLYWTLHGKIAAASSLVAGVTLSRVGLWGFDLSAQMIVQDQVEYDQRGAFSTTEASFQNLFEMLSYVTTLIFSRPDQFKWPVIISTIAVYTAGSLYTFYVRRQRGHLLHFDNLMKGKEWHPWEWHSNRRS